MATPSEILVKIEQYILTGGKRTLAVRLREILNDIVGLLGVGGGVEVTDAAKRTALKLATNWVNPNDAGDLLYYKMTLNMPNGQSEHDYYIGIDTATNTAFRYTYEKIDGTLAWIRMPLQISISGL